MDRGEGAAAPAAKPRDWYSLVLLEWMWRPDGLALRPGSELMVYATIYRASAHGGGAYVATNESMGRALGYPRETVSRATGRLLKAGLIWVVGSVTPPGGGRAVKWYAVCQDAIERAMAGIEATALARARDAGEQEVACAGDVTDGNADGDASFRQPVTERHARDGMRDATSRERCDGPSRVTDPHIAQNVLPPAQTSLFDPPPISTYHLSTDQGSEEGRGDGGGPAGACAGNGAPSETMAPHLAGGAATAGRDAAVPSASGTAAADGLTETDEAAFQTLLGKSMRPVDAAYVEANRAEFRRMLSEGVTANVVLTAYDEYVAYQHRLAVQTGACRPMHLLTWLRQAPNKNVEYVLRRLDGSWSARHPRQRPGSWYATPGGKAKPSPTHEDPRLERCWDGKVPLWYVGDERGTRQVEGSRGVRSPTRARALYEAMYARERA